MFESQSSEYASYSFHRTLRHRIVILRWVFDHYTLISNFAELLECGFTGKLLTLLIVILALYKYCSIYFLIYSLLLSLIAIVWKQFFSVSLLLTNSFTFRFLSFQLSNFHKKKVDNLKAALFRSYKINIYLKGGRFRV